MNNDLISREALKKAISELPNDNPSYYYTGDFLDREKVLDEIDNAPTVEAIPLEVHEKAMDVAVDDLFKVQEELNRIRNEKRPQGDLIKPLTELCDRYCKNCPITYAPNDCTDCICTHIRGIINRNNDSIQRKLPGCRRGSCKDCKDKDTCNFSSVR